MVQNLVYEKIPYFERRLTQLQNQVMDLLNNKTMLLTLAADQGLTSS